MVLVHLPCYPLIVEGPEFSGGHAVCGPWVLFVSVSTCASLVVDLPVVVIVTQQQNSESQAPT